MKKILSSTSFDLARYYLGPIDDSQTSRVHLMIEDRSISPKQCQAVIDAFKSHHIDLDQLGLQLNSLFLLAVKAENRIEARHIWDHLNPELADKIDESQFDLIFEHHTANMSYLVHFYKALEPPIIEYDEICIATADTVAEDKVGGILCELGNIGSVQPQAAQKLLSDHIKTAYPDRQVRLYVQDLIFDRLNSGLPVEDPEVRGDSEPMSEEVMHHLFNSHKHYQLRRLSHYLSDLKGPTPKVVYIMDKSHQLNMKPLQETYPKHVFVTSHAHLATDKILMACSAMSYPINMPTMIVPTENLDDASSLMQERCLYLLKMPNANKGRGNQLVDSNTNLKSVHQNLCNKPEVRIQEHVVLQQVKTNLDSKGKQAFSRVSSILAGSNKSDGNFHVLGKVKGVPRPKRLISGYYKFNEFAENAPLNPVFNLSLKLMLQRFRFFNPETYINSLLSGDTHSDRALGFELLQTVHYRSLSGTRFYTGPKGSQLENSGLIPALPQTLLSTISTALEEAARTESDYVRQAATYFILSEMNTAKMGQHESPTQLPQMLKALSPESRELYDTYISQIMRAAPSNQTHLFTQFLLKSSLQVLILAICIHYFFQKS